MENRIANFVKIVPYFKDMPILQPEPPISLEGLQNRIELLEKALLKNERIGSILERQKRNL